MFYRVFMDTNIYDGANYSFRNAMFQCLREYATKDELCLVVNSIIEGEVRSHIRDRIKEQITKLNKVVTDRTFAAFKHLAPFMDIIEKKNPDDWIDACDKEFSTLLNDCKAEKISVNGVGVEKIVSDYFIQAPPFEAKKPYEFKDAIAVSSLLLDIHSSLENRKKSENMNMDDLLYCVISNDKGFVAAVNAGLSEAEREYIRIFPELKNFVGYITLMNRQAEFLKAYLLSDCAQDEMVETVRNAIDNTVIDISLESGEFIDEQDIIDVEEISFQPYILGIYEEDGTALSAKVALDANCVVKVWYKYTDEDNSYWDKEDSTYLWKTEVEKEGRYQVELEVVISINIEGCRVPDDWNVNDDYDYADNVIEFDDYLDVPARLDLDETNLVDEEIVEQTEPFFEYEHDGEVFKEKAVTICPDCGEPIGIQNDGGNGFCINCAYKH